LEAFRDNDIDLDVLSALTDDDLKELGVSLGDRKRLRLALAEAPAAGPAAPPSPEPPPVAPTFVAPTLVAPERRQLTVLFADLVASTALSRDLDPEDLRDLLTAYHQAVSAAIRDAGGFVAKFMGDGVLAYFGYPVASEDAGERAVRAGLRAVAVVAALPARDGRRLQARVGIATGPVVVGDVVGDDIAREINVVGETPNLAARLLGVGDPGSVVIADSTRRLIGDLFVLQALEPQAIKGFAEPVVAFRVVEERQGLSRFEATRRGQAQGGAFVGRGREAGLLLDLWQQARLGDDQLVLLSGEAGIGKSRITESLWQAVAAEPQLRLRYQCTPHHSNSALYPALAQLAAAAGLQPDDDVPARLASAIPVATEEQRLLIAAMLGHGVRNPAIDDLTPARRRQLVLDVFAEQLAADCRRLPVLWVIEDAHWIDPTTEALISRVLDGAGRQRLMVVVTHRPEYQPPWGAHPMATTVPLGRLSRTNAELLLKGLANGRAIPPAVAEYIAGRADGVPLFMEELFKAMCDSGALAERGDRYELTQPLTSTEIPATLQDSLMARLDRLAPAKIVAQLGAAIGREFEQGLLLAVAGLKPEAVAEGLKQLLDAGLLFSRREGAETTYIFKHALIQDAAYGSLLRQRRQEVHERIARAIVDGGTDQRPELIAHHFEAAGRPHDAATWLERGGDTAFASAANREAAVLWRRTLALMPRDSDAAQRRRIQVLQKLGAALLQADGYSSEEAFEAGQAALQVAQSLGDIELYVRVCASNAPTHFARQKFDRVERELAFVTQAQLDQLPATVRTHYHCIRGVCHFHVGRIGLAHDDLSTILGLDGGGESDSSFGGGDPRFVALSYLARAQVIRGYVDTATTLGQRALDYARSIAHAYSVAWGLVTVTRNAIARGTEGEALGLIRESIELCERHGYASRLGQARAAHGMVLAMTGNIEEGAREVEQGLELWRQTGNIFSLDLLLVEAGHVFMRLDEPDAARPFIDQAGALYQDAAERSGYAEYLRLSGRLLERAGDGSGAAARYREAIAFADGQSANLYKLRASTDLARLLAGEEDRAAALAVLRPVLDWFTEGHDAVDVSAARTLVAGLQPAM